MIFSKAKKLCLSGSSGTSVNGLIQVSGHTDTEKLLKELEAKGAIIGAWIETKRLLSAKLPAADLSTIAEVDGVVYVEVDEKLS